MLLRHTRTFVVGILCIGGMISFGVVYATLSSPYISYEDVPEDGGNVSVADDSIASVFSWFDAKEKAQSNVPSIPNTAFSIPSAL